MPMNRDRADGQRCEIQRIVHRLEDAWNHLERGQYGAAESIFNEVSRSTKDMAMEISFANRQDRRAAVYQG